MLGGAGEAARIFITVGLNAASAASGLKALGSQVDGFGAKVSAWGKSVSSAFSGPLDAFGRIGDAADGVRSVAGAVAGLAQTIFGGAARNEQYAQSFELLLGSTEKATEHIAKLKKFAAETPFTLPGIVEVSRQLEVMGGGALDTIDNIRLVGDVAAGTGAEIQAVGVQFGRLYDGLKNGTPLGEVMMRLGELGAISGDSRRKILKLAEGVQSGAMDMKTAWAQATKEFSRFHGITAKQAESLGGLWSTFTDTVDEGFSKLGTKLMPMIKPVLKGAIDLFGKMGDAADFLVDHLDIIGPVILGVAIPAVIALTAAVWGLAAGVIAATWPFIAIGLVLAGLYKILEALFPGVDILGVALGTLGKVVDTLLTPFKALGSVIGWVAEQLGVVAPKLSGTAVSAGKMADDIASSTGKMADDMGGAGAQAAEAFDPIVTAAGEAQQSLKGKYTTMVEDLRAYRDGVRTVAQNIADATYDPIILAGEIAQTQIDLQHAKAEAAEKGHSAREQAILDGRVAELRKQLAVKNEVLRTYGSEQAQIAADAAAGSMAAEVKAMKEKNPELRAALMARIEYHRQHHREVMAQAASTGEGAGLTYARNLGGAAVRQGTGKAAGDVWRTANTVLGASFASSGRGAGSSWADGLEEMKYYAKLAAKRFLYEAKKVMEFRSPAKEGPWREVDTWGQRAGKTFADMLGGQASYLASQAVKFLGGAESIMASPTLASPKGSAGMTPYKAGAMGGPQQLTVQLDFHSATPYSPAEQEQLGQRVGPAVYDYLRQRGALA